MSQSTAAFSSPFAARASSTAEPSLVTATLNTSLPAIRMPMSTLRVTGSTFNPVEMPLSTYSRSLYAPSECRCVLMMPGSAEGLSTTAPAPSANNTAVLRSFQLVMRDSVSLPMTSAHLASPSFTNLSASDNA
jgi:hypothetical protein